MCTVDRLRKMVFCVIMVLSHGVSAMHFIFKIEKEEFFIMSFKVGMLTEACRRKVLVYCQKRGGTGVASLAEVLFDSKKSEYLLRYLDGAITHLIRNTSNQLEPIDLIEVHTVPTRELLERRQRISFDEIMFGGELLPPDLKEIILKNEQNCVLA